MANNVLFTDRVDAGRRLAAILQHYKGQDVVIFAMTRGGVPVGKEIALSLRCPLEPLIIRKIGHPYNPEYAIGACAEDGTAVFNEDETASLSKAWLAAAIAKQKREIEKKRALYLTSRTPSAVKGKVVVIVDDGIATGLSMLAAISYINKKAPAKVVVAVPVAPQDIAIKFKQKVDEFVAVSVPQYYLGAVGSYYRDFTQVSDEEVVRTF